MGSRRGGTFHMGLALGLAVGVVAGGGATALLLPRDEVAARRDDGKPVGCERAIPSPAVGTACPSRTSEANTRVPRSVEPPAERNDVDRDVHRADRADHDEPDDDSAARSGQRETPSEGRGDRTPPALPLPRFPGARQLALTENYEIDPQTGAGSWVIVQALRAPAPWQQVVGFYRKALEAASLPTWGGNPVPEESATRSILHGRGTVTEPSTALVHAQISIVQPAHRLQTRIRVIWRQWD